MSSQVVPSLARDRLQELLRAMQGRRVVIVGDAMLDVYLHGEVDRISPEAPVPVVRVRDRRYALGGAANVAQNVISAGALGYLVATIGKDVAGERLRTMLAALSADGRGLIDVDRPTTTKTRLVARAQQVVRFDEEEDADLSATEVRRIAEHLDDLLTKADALVLEDYNKGVLVPAIIERAIAAARERRIPIVVDPKFRNFFAFRGATVFKPNRRELESALGASVVLDDIDTLPDVFRRLGVDHLLLTLGERGMVLISANGTVGRIPTTAREVYDVVGAGDTVTAYLATALAAGATACEAAVVANYAAGVEVGKLGAATVTPEEVMNAYDSHRSSSA
ncbi:MAG: Bifunctional protein HldE [Gemmatimonadaceae bacterium]|nr:Bifunctional protein HldE [Gemmatimonadaceae bacterium]